MTDIISQSESDRIVAQGREERASKIAHGLKPAEEVPKMNLTNPTRAETRDQYLKRCAEHRISSNFKDSDD